MSDMSFRVQVNPEVIQKYNDQKIDNLVNKHGLNKQELNGDGIQMGEADGMQLNTFKKLAGGANAITKATLIKFDDGTETPVEKAAREIQKVMPDAMVVKGPKSKATDEHIFIQSKYGDTKDQSFTMVGSNDKNRDGKIQIESEIMENDMVKTTNDAIELGGNDFEATPDEAMNFYLRKKGIETSDLKVTSEKAQPLNTKLGELLDLNPKKK